MARAAWRAAEADDADALGDLDGIAKDTERRLAEDENVYGATKLEEMAPGLPRLLAGWWVLSEGDRESGFAEASKKGQMPTHDELRDRWLVGQEAPTAFGHGGWLRYGVGFWAPVPNLVVYREIDAVLEGAKPERVRPNAGARSSIENMARAKAFVPDEEWDANADALVCANGTFDVSSGVLREHRPDDYALGAVPFAYDPKAEAPTWRSFLDSTVPDAAPFLQEFAGYCLTVETLHEIAVWLHGPPGTGKSTFIEGLKAMLGPRTGLLGLAELQRNRFALADLPGKTLVVATEQPSDFISITHLLNAIISGEETRVEEKFKPAYTVVPRAKICWAMNELPRVKDPNNGLFRRAKIVEFPARAEGDRDETVKEAIKTEGAGILNWALDGLARLKERGRFDVPESVRAATEEFRLGNDVPRMFVEEVCVFSNAEGHEVQAAELYEAYKNYCETYGYRPMSLKRAAGEWRRLGFGERNLHGRKYYMGLKIDSDWPLKEAGDSAYWNL